MHGGFHARLIITRMRCAARSQERRANCISGTIWVVDWAVRDVYHPVRISSKVLKGGTYLFRRESDAM